MSALLKKLTTANSHRVSSTTNQPIRTRFKALKVRYFDAAREGDSTLLQASSIDKRL